MSRIPSQSRLHQGLRVEERACAFLILSRKAVGARIIARNYRWRGGELDIVLEEVGSVGRIELVFVEVRARGPDSYVDGIGSVSVPKQFRLRRTIERYLASYRGAAHTVRVDVLAWNGQEWVEARNVRLAGEF